MARRKTRGSKSRRGRRTMNRSQRRSKVGRKSRTGRKARTGRKSRTGRKARTKRKSRTRRSGGTWANSSKKVALTSKVLEKQGKSQMMMSSVANKCQRWIPMPHPVNTLPKDCQEWVRNKRSDIAIQKSVDAAAPPSTSQKITPGGQ